MMKPLRLLLILIASFSLLGAQPKTKSTGAKTTASSASTSKLVDINSASTEELEALPGIGKVYAQKIIAGRRYANKTQLVSKGILPQAIYNKISAQVIAKQKN